MSRRKTINAIIFSIVMVLSMVAFAATGVGAIAPGADQPVEATDYTPDDEGLAEAGSVSPGLESAEGETRVMVYLDQADVGPQMAPDEIEATLKAQADRTQPAVTDELEGLGVDVHGGFWLVNALSVTYDADEVSAEALASVEGVEFVYDTPDVEPPEVEEVEGTPEDSHATFGLEQINATEFWDEYDTQGEGAKIVIQDNGFDTDHEALDFEEAHFINSTGGKDGPPAENEHGTHTSGTAAGGEDGDGMAIGVAPNVELHGHDIFSASDVVAASIGSMQIAAEEDATAVSGSWGSGCNLLFPSPVYNDAQIDPINNTREMGTEVVSSSGNAGEGCVGGFANDHESFSIGGTAEGAGMYGSSSGSLIDKDTGQPNWPDAGAFSDPPAWWPQSWIAPRVAAPAEAVYSSTPGDTYGQLSGTSMASPHVAGSLALLQSATDEKLPGPELREALVETAWKPDDWDPNDAEWTNNDTTMDQPGIDSRYGHGIIDVMAAIDYLGPDVSENPLGDVDESGNVTIDDAVLVQEYLAGILDPNDTFNEDLGDVDRDGNVTIDDAVKVQEHLAELISQGEIEIRNLDVPDEVGGGDPLEVTANLTNVQEMGAIELVEAQLADDFADPISTDEMAVDMAIDGIEDPVDLPSEASVTFSLDTSGVPGGNYSVGVFTEDHNQTAETTVLQPFFDVTDLNAPSEVDQGELLEANATVENTGNEAATMDAEYVFAGTVEESQSVTLDPGETTTVDFDLETDNVSAGTYEHGIQTPDASAMANVTVNEPFFDVTNVDGPGTVSHGDEITVDATVENTGGAPDEQTVEYDIGTYDVDVAVVDTDLTTDDGLPEDAMRDELAARGLSDAEIDERLDDAGVEQMNDFSDFLDAELSDAYNVYDLHPDDLLDNTGAFDVFVISQFDDQSRVVDLYDDLGDDQAVIHLDQWSPTQADGILSMSNEMGNPGTFSTGFSGAGADLHITQDHPLFDGVGGPGDTIEYHSAASSDRGWFSGYDGEVLADISAGGGSADGAGVGVDDSENQILLPTSARVSYVTHSDFSDDEHQIMLNAVEYAANEQIASAAAMPQSTETLQLDPGESDNITFTYNVSSDDGVGDMSHIVESEDDAETAPVTVQSPEQVDVNAVDAPDELHQGETFDIDVEVENVGGQTSTQDIEVLFDGELVDTIEVTLDPGDVETETAEHTVPLDLEPGTYTIEGSVDFDSASTDVDVVEADEATFEVSDFQAPAEAGQGDTIDVSATIENTGDLEDTQTIEYVFDVGGDDGGELEEADVLIVDEAGSSDYYADDMAGLIDDHLDNETFTVDTLESDNEDLIAAMDDYDVFVIQRFGSDAIASDFLDNLGDDQGAVYLGSEEGFTSEGYADGIERLVNVRGDPVGFQVEDNAESEIAADHPIFEGLGGVGDVLPLNVGLTTYGSSAFTDYSGTTLATDPGTGVPEIAVNDDETEILGGSLGWTFSADTPGDWSAEWSQLLANMVHHSADAAVTGSAPESAGIDVSEQLDDDSTDLTLDANESTDVSFSYDVPLDQTPGTYEHLIASEDGEVSDNISIYPQESDIGVTGWFPDPDPAEGPIFNGDTMTADVTVANDGEASGEFEAKFTMGNQTVDSQVVEVDANDVEVITLNHTFDQTGTVTMAANWVDPIEFDVEEPDPADFQVDITDYDEQVMYGDEVAVNATIENVGEAQDTQTIAFDAGETTVASEDVTLRHEESADVSFTYETEEADVPEIEASVASENDSASEDVIVDAPALFDVNITDAPDVVPAGEDVNLEVNVENLGTLEGTQTVGVTGLEAVDVTDVAVVNGAGDITSTLSDNLNEDEYNVEDVAGGDLIDEMDGYDLFVIEQLDSGIFSDFLDEIGDDQGMIVLEGPGGSDPGGIDSLSDVRTGLSVNNNYTWQDYPVQLEITSDHTIFDGLGSVGDSIDMHDEAFADRAWFSGSEMDVLAGSTSAGSVALYGDGLAIDEEANEILLANYGASGFPSFTDYTEDSHHLLANSVTVLADGLDEGGAGYAVSENVTLDGAESDTLNFTLQTTEEDIGDVTIEASSNDTADDVDVSIVEAPNFEVEITDTPDQVLAGEEVDVNATVENTGDLEDTQTVDFSVNDSQQTSQQMTLGAGESQDVSFTYVTDEEDSPAIETAVTSGDDADNATVTVDIPATFEVTIDDHDDEVVEGDTVSVDATIENVGTLSGTQDIDLAVDTSVEDTAADVQLDGGESTSLTLTYDTDTNDVGTIDLEVSSDDDAASAETTVLEEAFFDVTIDSVDDPVETFETIDVTATVENTGEEDGTSQTVEFIVNGTVEDTQTVSLDGGQGTPVNFAYDTVLEDAGETLDIAVSSDDTDDTETSDVEHIDPNLTVEITDASPDPIDSNGQQLQVTANLTNEGTQVAEQDIELVVDGTVRDTAFDQDVQPQETEDVTLGLTTEAGDAPEIDAEVHSENDTDSTTVTVEHTEQSLSPNGTVQPSAITEGQQSQNQTVGGSGNAITIELNRSDVDSATLVVDLESLPDAIGTDNRFIVDDGVNPVEVAIDGSSVQNADVASTEVNTDPDEALINLENIAGDTVIVDEFDLENLNTTHLTENGAEFDYELDLRNVESGGVDVTNLPSTIHTDQFPMSVPIPTLGTDGSFDVTDINFDEANETQSLGSADDLTINLGRDDASTATVDINLTPSVNLGGDFSQAAIDNEQTSTGSVSFSTIANDDTARVIVGDVNGQSSVELQSFDIIDINTTDASTDTGLSYSIETGDVSIINPDGGGLVPTGYPSSAPINTGTFDVVDPTAGNSAATTTMTRTVI